MELGSRLRSHLSGSYATLRKDGCERDLKLGGRTAGKDAPKINYRRSPRGNFPPSLAGACIRVLIACQSRN